MTESRALSVLLDYITKSFINSMLIYRGMKVVYVDKHSNVIKL